MLRCDLREAYGINLDDLFKGRLSWADVAELTAGLRPGSRIHKSWSQEEHLLADQVDLMTRLVWLQGLATSASLDKRDKKLLNKPPRLLDRPGEIHKEKLVFTKAEDLKSLLGGVQKPEPGPDEIDEKAYRRQLARDVLKSI